MLVLGVIANKVQSGKSTKQETKNPTLYPGLLTLILDLKEKAPCGVEVDKKINL